MIIKDVLREGDKEFKHGDSGHSYRRIDAESERSTLNSFGSYPLQYERDSTYYELHSVLECVCGRLVLVEIQENKE